MRLVLLGTTGYHPTETRHTPCFLLPEVGVLFDAGTGMFRTASFLATDHLDIFLSHAHLDHVVGLTYFIDILYRKPLDRVRVFGEREKLDAIRTHLFSEFLFPSAPPVEWVALEEDAETPIPRDGRLTWFPLEHKGGSVGYRIDWPDRSMAYVTDTSATPTAAYLEKIRGVDLLVHECYFPDEHAELAASTGHSSTSAVARLAKDAGVKRLVLTHFNPLADADDPIVIDDARAIFPETIIGEDNMTVEF